VLYPFQKKSLPLPAGIFDNFSLQQWVITAIPMIYMEDDSFIFTGTVTVFRITGFFYGLQDYWIFSSDAL